MIIEEIQDGDKSYNDPMGIGIVIYPETDSEIKIINKLINHPEYLRDILNNLEDEA